MTLKLHWELDDKRCNVDGYANLPNRDVEDLLGVYLMMRFRLALLKMENSHA